MQAPGFMRGIHASLGLLVLASSCPSPGADLCDEQGVARWFVKPAIFARGRGVTNEDCRSGDLCRHNENTDLFRHRGDLYLVHRTAMSQILGPNSALLVYRSQDEGRTFARISTIPAVNERDIRDPAFYEVGGALFLKAITRVRGFTPRDQDVHSISVAFRSDDGGATWEDWSAGLDTTSVSALEVDPADPRRIYAVTTQGIWLLNEAD